MSITNENPPETRAHLILYVTDQESSKTFYEVTLSRPPRLHVPGMTEFVVGGAVLGLMPEAEIRQLLGTQLLNPADANGCPRAELYLVVNDPDAFHRRALAAGARELSPLMARFWGHDVAYSLDPKGHVLAFAISTEIP